MTFFLPDEESSEEEQKKHFTTEREAYETPDSGKGCLAIIILLIIGSTIVRLVN